jgi:acyl carrier protein
MGHLRPFHSEDQRVTDVQAIEHLQAYFAKELRGKTLAPDDGLLSSGLLDSLAIVKLLSYLEDEFDVEIDDADFDPENFETINSIAALISSPSS